MPPSEFMFKKPVLKLILPGGVNFLKNVFNCLSLCASASTGFKTKPLRQNKSTVGFIYSSDFMFLLGVSGLKTKPRRRNKFSEYISPSGFCLKGRKIKNRQRDKLLEKFIYS